MNKDFEDEAHDAAPKDEDCYTIDRQIGFSRGAAWGYRRAIQILSDELSVGVGDASYWAQWLENYGPK